MNGTILYITDVNAESGFRPATVEEIMTGARQALALRIAAIDVADLLSAHKVRLRRDSRGKRYQLLRGATRSVVEQNLTTARGGGGEEYSVGGSPRRRGGRGRRARCRPA